MAGDKALHLTIITPARSVFDDDAAAVVVPAFDGEMGILPGHAPLISLLGAGPLRVTLADGKVRHLVVREGFVQVKGNQVAVLTPESQTAGELDGARIEAEIAQLDAEHPTRLEEREALEQKRRWALARRRVLEAHKAQHRN